MSAVANHHQVRGCDTRRLHRNSILLILGWAKGLALLMGRLDRLPRADRWLRANRLGRVDVAAPPKGMEERNSVRPIRAPQVVVASGQTVGALLSASCTMI